MLFQNTSGNICGEIIIQVKMYLNVFTVGKELKNKEPKDLGCACYGNNQVHTCFCKETKSVKLQKVEVTMQEIWQQTKPKVHKSKKAYTRKNKHKSE